MSEKHLAFYNLGVGHTTLLVVLKLVGMYQIDTLISLMTLLFLIRRCYGTHQTKAKKAQNRQSDDSMPIVST